MSRSIWASNNDLVGPRLGSFNPPKWAPLTPVITDDGWLGRRGSQEGRMNTADWEEEEGKKGLYWTLILQVSFTSLCVSLYARVCVCCLRQFIHRPNQCSRDGLCDQKTWSSKQHQWCVLKNSYFIHRYRLNVENRGSDVVLRIADIYSVLTFRHISKRDDKFPGLILLCHYLVWTM